MKKILFLYTFCLTAISAFGQGIDYKSPDYRFWYKVSVGTASSTMTPANAYLQVGPASGSTQGMFIPRGDTAAVVAPTKGLLFNKISNNTVYIHTGNYWKALGTGGGGGGGITSLNGLTAPSQTFDIGVSGTLPNWNSSGFKHVLNIPEASPTVGRGLINQSSQSIGGYKTFVPFIGGGGGSDVNNLIQILNPYNGTQSKLGFDAQGGIYGTGVLAGAMPTYPVEDLPKFIWLPQKGAFRAGQASGTKWSTDSIGNYTVAFGRDNVVLGGFNTVVNGLWNSINGGAYNTIVGAGDTIASGQYNYISGVGNNIRQGSYHFISGENNNISYGERNYLFGDGNNLTDGDRNVVFGRNNTMSLYGANNFVNGYGNDVNGYSNRIFGGNNYLSENTEQNNIFGTGNTVDGYAIHLNVFGDYNTFDPNIYNSFLIGSGHVLNSPYSFVVGDADSTSSNYQENISLGSFNRTYGTWSKAIGYGVSTSSAYEIALGTFNKQYAGYSEYGWDGNDRLLSIGNGEDRNTRSNAMVILKNGNTGIGVDVPTEKVDIAGNVQFDGALMPRGQPGNLGEVLISNAANQPPSWVYLKQSNEEFTATSGQSLFPLATVPRGDVAVFKNGSLMPISSYNLSVSDVTMDAPLSAGDRLNVVYMAEN